MRLENERESENVEDRRGQGMSMGLGRGGSIGLGTIALALVAMYFGVDPSFLLDGSLQPPTQSAPAGKPPANDAQAKFVSMVLADTEDTWRELFRSMNRQYEDPTLVLFTGATPTGCGTGQAAMGPFYCPQDHKLYIDLAFYHDLQTRFHAPGEFAQAYVIAHEVGHHVQNLLGISGQVQQRQLQAGGQAQANGLSVRLELQADCLAGVWANHANRARSILEQGDIESAINAATAIGDDRLQQQSRGYAVPDTFTHGSSAQRVEWFGRGLKSGDLRQCDTFSGPI